MLNIVNLGLSKFFVHVMNDQSEKRREKDIDFLTDITNSLNYNGIRRNINSDMSCSNFSRDQQSDTFAENFNYSDHESLHQTAQKLCSDKTTYCRPVVNFHNEQFLYRTMEKNAKLQRLVQELEAVRQEDNDKEDWRNYINELRKKHSGEKVKRPTALFIQSDINSYYNTLYRGSQSKPCQKLLKDFYNANGITQSYELKGNSSKEYEEIYPKSYIPYDTNALCYPTSSQGRLIMLQRERQKRLDIRKYKQFCKHDFPAIPACGEETDIPLSHKHLYLNKSLLFENCNMNNTMVTTSTQTLFWYKNNNLISKKAHNIKNKVSKAMCTEEQNRTETLQEHSTQCPLSVKKDSSLASIEEKIDSLIHSINHFMLEIKAKSRTRQYNPYRATKLAKEDVNFTRRDSCGIIKNKEEKVYKLHDNSNPYTKNSSSINFSEIKHINNDLNKINDILMKEINKNKVDRIKLKDSSVRKVYNPYSVKFMNETGNNMAITLKDSCVEEDSPCSVKISVHIPTKDISTEVTRSLSKAGFSLEDRNIVITEIGPTVGQHKQIAIAVNTDPFSILSLLKVTTEETLKRLMSYVPNIDFHHYLSRIPDPKPGTIECHYACSICGALFLKPSQLTDHVQDHERRTRDCSVCLHILERHRRYPGLFKCQYCGQPFTRAYCCELHQQSCATSLGILHDNTSSLMILK